MFFEDLIQAVALYCDGAKARDGMGFSKSEAQEGKRLAMMAKAGLNFSLKDAETVQFIVRKYAKQSTSSQEILREIKNNKINFKNTPQENVEYKYIATSPDNSKFYIYFFPWKQSYKRILSYIREIPKKFMHGERKINLKYKKAKVSINNEEHYINRWELDLNSTSEKILRFIAGKFDFIMDDVYIDSKFDELKKSIKIAYQEKENVVIEHPYNSDFIARIKKDCQYSYESRTNKWTIHKGPVKQIILDYKIKYIPELFVLDNKKYT